MKKFAFSTDSENYQGSYDTEEEAFAEAFLGYGGDRMWVGEMREPAAPWELVDARLLIEAVDNDEDYHSDWAEGWNETSKAQREELTEMVQATFKTWCEKYGVKATHFAIDNPKEMSREEWEAKK